MYCYRKVTEDLYWIGACDRRQTLFEGVYDLRRGMAYNAYLLLGEQTVLFDTVDRAVADVFFENLEHLLDGRSLDYLVVHHMEPDHSATLAELVLRYPSVQIICSAKTQAMMKQFFTFDADSRVTAVKEGEKMEIAGHAFTFVMAPMVHWPEVMMTYDETDRVLFSADAFGTFGALDGALFADEVDFEREYLPEARRYYANIVGKFGPQVQNVLKKAQGLDLAMVCPLHGFVWRKDIGWYVDKYDKWSRYEPEEAGVLIAYGSIYGHTANAAEILACALREQGVRVRVLDLSVETVSEAVSQVFRFSHIVLASASYNASVFIRMHELLSDLKEHNFQNRTVALIENGSWAPSAARTMQGLLEGCKNLTFLEPTMTIKSALTAEQREQLADLAGRIAQDLKEKA